jgi:hypothetical protein
VWADYMIKELEEIKRSNGRRARFSGATIPTIPIELKGGNSSPRWSSSSVTPGLAPLGVQVGAVGDGPMTSGRGRGPVHAGLQRLIAESVDLGPIEPSRAGAQHRGPNGATTDPQALRHLPVGAPEVPLLPQDLSYLAHGQSLGGYPSPFRGRGGPTDGPRR